MVVDGVLIESNLVVGCEDFDALLLLAPSFLEGCAFGLTSRTSAGALGASAVRSFSAAAFAFAFPLTALISPCAPFHFFITGSGLSVRFRLILFMKCGMSTTGSGLDL
jgi:hypothetical protein